MNTDTRRFQNLLWVFILVLAGLGLAGLTYASIHNMKVKALQAEFKSLAVDRLARFHEELTRDLDFLRHLRAFYNASSFVAREEFAHFTRETLKEHPQIELLGWAPRIAESGRANFLSETHSENNPAFQVWTYDAEGMPAPVSARKEYAPVLYAEPRAQNALIAGYDLLSSAVLRPTVETSRDSGEIAVSAMISIQSIRRPEADPNTDEYLVALIPVFRDASESESVQARRDHLEGYLFSAFQFELLIKEYLFDQAAYGWTVEIFDITDAGRALPILSHGDRSSGEGESAAKSFAARKQALQYSQDMHFGGRSWRFDLTAWRYSRDGMTANLEWIAALTVLAFSGLLIYLFMLMTLRRDAVEREVAIRSAQLRLVTDRLRSQKMALDQFAIVAETDVQGRITYVNNQFCNVSKYSREELLGQDHRMVNSGYHPKSFFKNMWATIGGGQVWREEVKNRAKDGSFYWVDTAIVPLMGSDGKPEKYLAIRAVITERKIAEEELRIANRNLESANQDLKDFAYVVSHDLKAPLRAIGSLATWIAEDSKGKLDEESTQNMELLLGRVKRMDALIGAVLAYSRTAQSRFDKSVVDLDTLVREVIEFVSPPAHIKVELVNKLPEVLGEKTRLHQIFQNFLSNAIKYIDKPSGEVCIGCDEQEEDWRFYVADNGPGIEEKYFNKIFQIFQMLQSRDQQESTGVGLAIVKKAVELLDGNVWVESEVGKGTTFYFTLPKVKTGSVCVLGGPREK